MARQQVPNYELGHDTARLNLLTNGGLEVWQRGNGPFSTSGIYTADRWHTLIAGNDTLSISRGSGASAVATGGAYSAQVAATVGTGAGGTGFYQRFRPGDNVDHLRGRTVTLSAWFSATTVNSTRLRIYTVQGDSATSPFHSGSGLFEWLSVTLAIPLTATDIFVGLQFMATVSLVFFDAAMLVIGSVPAAYAPLHPADDLARCERYYTVMPMQTLVIGGSAHAAGMRLFQVVGLPTTMVTTPSITTSAAATWTGANTSSTVPGTWGPRQNAFGCHVTSVAAGESYLQGGVNSFFYLEANP